MGASTRASSLARTVTVVPPAAVPTITADLPSALEVTRGAEAPALTVAAVTGDGGALSYQWFRDGQAIDGAVGPMLTPDATETGRHTYHVVVTNTVLDSTAAATSSSTTVTVVAPGGENPGGENPGGENSGGENPGGGSEQNPGTDQGGSAGASDGAQGTGARDLAGTGSTFEVGAVAAIAVLAMLGGAALVLRRALRVRSGKAASKP